MLASLFRGSSGQRSSQQIESVTDDAHTRNLLFGQSQQILNLPTSPPPSPFGSPVPRPSSYDDRGGLDLEEKDVRVLLAQDAHGGEEKPTLLFDSRRAPDGASQGRNQPAVRSPLPQNWHTSQGSASKAEDASRARSSTFSGSQSSWSKANRDLAPKDDPFLECMFGVTSSTKTTTSTKMHIIPAKTRPSNASDRQPRRPPQNVEQRRRAPLSRAHTSGQPLILSSLEDNSRDALLITRLFHVTLHDHARVVAKPASPGVGPVDKPLKLLERKVPAFAVGLVVQLPYPSHRPQSSQSRFASQTSNGQSFASPTSSFGSEMHSPWTFMDAIPQSLSPSFSIIDDGDRRVDMVVANWDVILRSISKLERVATEVITKQLHLVLGQMAEPEPKVPKEKSMQRPNQRVVAIDDVTTIAKAPVLLSISSALSRRIVKAVRIPRVITGLGITAGHWTDEARMLFRSCGAKQQNFFLLNLLTAFLGNHMQWLERLAPEWYRKQFEASHRKVQESTVLASRTVIVSDHKGLARRLVYILASFLPGPGGIDGLHNLQDSTFMASSSSPSRRYQNSRTTRRPSKPFMARTQASGEPHDGKLSTSASSHGSHASTYMNSSPRQPYARKDSTRYQISTGGIETDSIKSSAGTASMLMPHASQTPTGYISGLGDSYFPEAALVSTNESIASTDLSKVLYRSSSAHRRTSSVSSKWGSLVSGISEIWSGKQSIPGDRGSFTTTSQEASPAAPHHKRDVSSVAFTSISNPLQMMVDELEQDKGTNNKADRSSPHGQSTTSPALRSPRYVSAAPRLYVDEEDGVIDVEVDLPGFMSASQASGSHLHSAKSDTRGMPFSLDGSDSVCSLSSFVSKRGYGTDGEQINVGGYLKRHHEDFTLHAVRPYNELLDDIKRSMRSEPTSPESLQQMLHEGRSHRWITVCTTLVADTRSFSIRRLTLRRQYQIRAPNAASRGDAPSTLLTNSASLSFTRDELTDETVMEFDTTLADAVEKVLNVSPSSLPRSTTDSHTHSRNVSISNGSQVGSSSIISTAKMPETSSHVQAAQLGNRDLVLNALENVVKSVNETLNKKSEDNLQTASSRSMDAAQHENALREGVKRWMLDVEQTSVW